MILGTTAMVNHRAQQWRSYALMLMASFGVVVSAWLIGYSLNLYFPLPQATADILELTGYTLWGTGLAKPKINHLTQCVPSKVLNRRLQVCCAEIGIFVFVLARTLT